MEADRPRELECGARVDRAVERFLINGAVGTAAGVALSFLFRQRHLKLMTIAFGAGTGLGMAWGDTRTDFANPNALHGRRLWRSSSWNKNAAE